MGPVVLIADPTDQRVDDYRNLTDAELRQREEPGAGLFMVEGPTVIRHLLESEYPVRSMLLSGAKFEQLRPILDDGGDWPVYVASNEMMRSITGFHFHRGALAAARRRPPADWRAIVEGQSLIAVAEDVGDHENMGALFRNAAAFGVAAILLSPGAVDPLYRRAVRVSMGQVLRVPWARAEPWPQVVAELKAAGFRVVALTPDPEGARPARRRGTGRGPGRSRGPRTHRRRPGVRRRVGAHPHAAPGGLVERGHGGRGCLL